MPNPLGIPLPVENALLPGLLRVFEGEGPFKAALWRQDALDAVLAGSSATDWLSDAESAAFAAIGASPERRREWLAARLALKALVVAGGAARRPGDAEILEDASGRPRVAVRRGTCGGRGVEFPCSISHSRPFVMCAFAEGADVGVDVQCSDARLVRLLGEFSSPRDSMPATGDPAADATLLWSVKEAFSKVLGTGLGCGFRDVSCRETAPGRCVVLGRGGEKCECRHMTLGRHAAAVAWRVLPAAESPAIC